MIWTGKREIKTPTTVVELRTQRKYDENQKIKERKAILFEASRVLAIKLEQLELYKDINKDDEEFIPYLLFLRKSIEKIGKISVEELNDDDFHALTAYYDALTKEVDDFLFQLEAYVLRKSFKYADASLDDMIGAYKAENASELMKGEMDKLNRKSPLSAFDAVRKKKNDDDDGGNGT